MPKEAASTVTERESATAVEREQSPRTAQPCVTDRRYVRSRRMIYDAAVRLIEQCGLDGFTVSDLTEAADLNRSTFYSHFKDKDELIRSLEDEFLAALSDVESRISGVTFDELSLALLGVKPLQPLVDLFDFLGQYGALLHALVCDTGDIRFEHRLLDTVCSTIVNKILNPKYQENPTRLLDFYVAYYSSAALGVVRTWIEGGMHESSAEMAGILVHLSFLNPGDPIEMGGDEHE